MEKKNDELLLESFFSEARAAQVSDEGFTAAVMRSIEARPESRLRLLSRLWTLIWSLTGIALIISSTGSAAALKGEIVSLLISLCNRLYDLSSAMITATGGINHMPTYVYLFPFLLSGIFAAATITRYKDL